MHVIAQGTFRVRTWKKSQSKGTDFRGIVSQQGVHRHTIVHNNIVHKMEPIRCAGAQSHWAPRGGQPQLWCRSSGVQGPCLCKAISATSTAQSSAGLCPPLVGLMGGGIGELSRDQGGDAMHRHRFWVSHCFGTRCAIRRSPARRGPVRDSTKALKPQLR